MFRRLAGLWVAAAALVTPVGGFVGLNLALMQQLVPLSPLLAAKRLKATFPTVEHVKLFDYNHDYLTALHAAGFVHVVVSIPNLELPAVARDPTAAARILEGLAPHVSAGMRLTIAVGNEPLAPWYNGAFRDPPGAGADQRASSDGRPPTRTCGVPHGALLLRHRRGHVPPRHGRLLTGRP